MIRRHLIRLVIPLLTLVVLTPTTVAERGRWTLAVEGGSLSLSSRFQGESPIGSGLMHAGRLDAEDA